MLALPVGALLVSASASDGTDASKPAPTVVPFPPSRAPIEKYGLEEHPQRDFFLHDPDGQQIRATFETGWAPYKPLEDGRIAFVPARFVGSMPGRVTEAVDADLTVVGYLISPGVFVEPDTFEDPDFDWRVFIEERLPEIGGDVVETIDAAGGLRPVEAIDGSRD